jgi:hypothetical protein
MLIRKENKIIRCTEGLELGNDDGKRCTLLRVDLSDFKVTKDLLIAHSGGITVKEQDGGIRTITCGVGSGLDHFGRIMITYSGISPIEMKRYLSEHPKAILNLDNKSDAFITEDRDYNYIIENIRKGVGVLSVWREADSELEIGIMKIATSDKR